MVASPGTVRQPAMTTSPGRISYHIAAPSPRPSPRFTEHAQTNSLELRFPTASSRDNCLPREGGESCPANPAAIGMKEDKENTKPREKKVEVKYEERAEKPEKKEKKEVLTK
eukprot:g27039.t1